MPPAPARTDAQAPAGRLALFPRSAEVQRLDGVLACAGQRLDRVDPPPAAPPQDELRPVLRLLAPVRPVPRADG